MSKHIEGLREAGKASIPGQRPAGFDTAAGYFARRASWALAGLYDPAKGFAEDTENLEELCRERGEPVVYVETSACLRARTGCPAVAPAFPLAILRAYYADAIGPAECRRSTRHMTCGAFVRRYHPAGFALICEDREGEEYDFFGDDAGTLLDLCEAQGERVLVVDTSRTLRRQTQCGEVALAFPLHVLRCFYAH